MTLTGIGKVDFDHALRLSPGKATLLEALRAAYDGGGGAGEVSSDGRDCSAAATGAGERLGVQAAGTPRSVPVSLAQVRDTLTVL